MDESVEQMGTDVCRKSWRPPGGRSEKLRGELGGVLRNQGDSFATDGKHGHSINTLPNESRKGMNILRSRAEARICEEKVCGLVCDAGPFDEIVSSRQVSAEKAQPSSCTRKEMCSWEEWPTHGTDACGVSRLMSSIEFQDLRCAFHSQTWVTE